MLRTATWLLVLIAAWLTFAPVPLGGRASYVVVDGNSMEPVYHRGDLIVAHAADEYEVGDIVTYRHPQIGPIIHRLIGRDGERYVFKGDHNDFIDPYNPAYGELIGRSWLHLPSAGAFVMQLRAPWAMAVLAVVGAIIVTTATNTSVRRGRRQLQRAPAAGQPASTSVGQQSALTVLAIAALVALALAAYAFARPTTTEVTEELAFRHTGSFGYWAASPPEIYDVPQARTGEPIFRQLSRSLTVTFDYRLASEVPVALRGQHRLKAEISASNGWKRTIELAPPTDFSGRTASVSGTIELGRLQALVERFEQQTGVEPREYRLAIVPEIVVTGELKGQRLNERFAPRLEFILDALQLQLTHGSSGDDQLRPELLGTLSRARPEPTSVTLFGLRAHVTTVRWASLTVLVLAVAGLLALAVPMLRLTRHDEASRIRLKHGALIVEAAGPLRDDTRVVALGSVDDLARVAERSGSLILHERRDDIHHYVVHDGHITYAYELGSAESQVPGTDEEAVDQPVAAWQATFLAKLCETGLTTEACRAAGVSIVTAYRERERTPSFARAWRAAQANAGRAAE